MNDFQHFAQEWQKLNDEALIKSVTFEDVEDQIQLHREGKLISPIKPTLRTLQGVFSWALGRLYLFTGYPQSGKTEMSRFLAADFSISTGHGVAVFTPESTTAIYLDELVTMHRRMLGSQGEGYVREKWSILEVEEGMPNVQQLIDAMDVEIIKGRRMFIIDPLNWVTSSNYTGGMWESLRLALTALKQFAKRKKCIVVYIEHPSTPKPNKDGEYPKANVFAVNMGIMHFNKVDCLVIMHRLRGQDMSGNAVSSESDDVEFEVAKMKDQKYMGRPGTVVLKYDSRSNIYADAGVEIKQFQF